MSALGLGTVAIGAYTVYYLQDKIFEALDQARALDHDTAVHNIHVEWGRRKGASLARKMAEQFRQVVNCDGADQGKVQRCYSAFRDGVVAAGGAFNALLYGSWERLYEMGLTKSKRPHMSDPLVWSLWMKRMEWQAKYLVECLEKAGCCPDCESVER